MISAKDLIIGFENRWQITIGTLDFDQNCVILGPNGAGKSTLLRTLAGLHPPISGEVQINDKNISEISFRDRAKQIAWVSQTEKHEFGWKALDYVIMGRFSYQEKLKDSNQDIESALEALKQVDGLHLQDRVITSLSGGEFQRIRIARGLTQNASTIILDEPTAHLDITHQTELIETLNCLETRLILTLHDLNQAVAFNARLYAVSESNWLDLGHSENPINKEALQSVYKTELESFTRSNGKIAYLPLTSGRTTDY